MDSPLLPVWPGASYAAHQVEGISWMVSQETTGYTVKGVTVRGGILGDEMGLGKTIQSLALIVNHKVRRTLIVTPLAVRKQWEEAGSRCDLNIYVAEGASWKAKTPIRSKRPDLFLGHYDKLNNDLALFQAFKFDRIILDEAHRVRNPRTAGAKNCLLLAANAKHRWCLTGTPIVNTLDDAVVYLRFIGAPVREESRTWQQDYCQFIRNCYLARTMDECEPPAGLTVPPEPEIEEKFLDFTNKQEEDIYEAIYKNLETKMRNAQSLRGRAYSLLFLQILLRLRQVSVTPKIYIDARRKEEFGWSGPDFNVPSRKFHEIANLLQDNHDAGKKRRWIIFCQFKAEMDLLTEFLKAQPTIGHICHYHGGLSHKERDEEIAKSKVLSTGAKQDVFLVQLQAGGTGLNLQHYDSAIFISPWWTAALMDQALGRVVRIGQTKTVKVYWLRLSSESHFNIDEFIMEKAEAKRKMADKFFDMGVGRLQIPVVDLSEDEEENSLILRENASAEAGARWAFPVGEDSESDCGDPC
jgi:SNF2 family DNA or RNA helicase